MSRGVNKCIFIGNLGADPETRQTGNGQPVANFRLAVSRSWKDKSGQQQEHTEWVPCVAWGKLSEIVGKFLQKGSRVYVEGEWRTREWADKDGNKRYTTEIVANEMMMLDGKSDGRQDSHNESKSNGYAPPNDDIPF